MILEMNTVGTLETNCYIYGDKAGEVVVIDPGAEHDTIMGRIKELACTVKYIVATHGHFDHIGAVASLKNQTGAKVLIHSLDAECLIDAAQNLSLYMGMAKTQQAADALLKDGDIIEIGKHKLLVIHTPGHTRGSICLKGEGILFSGDTLFRESAGRTDLPGGSTQELTESIKKLMNLDGSITVYPGHSEASSIEYERKNNPFFEK